MLLYLLTISDESNHSKIEYIYEKYHDFMMRYAVARFRKSVRQNPVLDAEDAVQNTFVKIVRYADRIDLSWGDTDVKNYCFTILSNEISNILDEKEIFFEEIEEFSLEKECNIIDTLQVKENYTKIVRAIEALDERYSTTLYLVFCREMTVGEVADMIGVSQKTVYTRLARGRKMLIDSLKGAGFDE